MSLSPRQRAFQIFTEAQDKDLEEREAYLREACAGDEAIREAVESLLAAAPRAGEYFDNLSRRLGAAAFLKGNDAGEKEPNLGKAGMNVGHYELQKQIGSGGMGSVWLAERTDGIMRRQVALKLPHPALLGKGFSERLEREREILASLAHPNIARLYDAGFTEEGQPFLALEYIDGVPLDEYFAERNLGVAQRIKLFLKVAHAVAYAHAQLVVHRDLKPANVLVDSEGEPHLLDFGVAKLLQSGPVDSGQLTQFAGRPLTPAYSSPEQILGGPISTTSDVYSLGVLLYEILTSERPYKLDRDSSGALETAILEAEPRPPSLVVSDSRTKKTLRGDIDTIVLKALKKTPDERYATVNALIDDLERFQNGKPVLAQPDSRRYRVTKFLMRHRVGVVSVLSIILAVIAGTSVAVWQAFEARSEQRRAEAVTNFITSIFTDANPYSGNSPDLTAIELLQQAEQRLNSATELVPETRVELMTVLTQSLSTLGGTDVARQLAQQTVDEATSHLGATHQRTLAARALLFNVLGPTVDLPTMKGDIEQLLQDVRDSDSALPETLTTALIAKVDLAYQEGDLQTAQEAAEEAYQVAQQHFPRRHPKTLEATTLLASAYQRNNENELAVQAAKELYEITFDELKLDPNHAIALDSRMMYGIALSGNGQFELGLDLIGDAVQRATKVYGPDNQSTAFFRGHLARFEGMAGLVNESADNYRKALSSIRSTLGEDNAAYIGGASRYVPMVLEAREIDASMQAAQQYSTLINRQETVSEFLQDQANGYLAMAHAYRNEMSEALERIERITAFRGVPHGSFADLLYVAGVVDRFNGKCMQALERQNQSLTNLRETKGDARQEMFLLTEIGLCQLELGSMDKAESSLVKAVQYFQANQPHITPRYSDALVGLARVHLAKQQAEAALPLLLSSRKFWTGFNATSRWAGLTHHWLSQTYLLLDQQDKAIQAGAQAEEILGTSGLDHNIQ